MSFGPHKGASGGHIKQSEYFVESKLTAISERRRSGSPRWKGRRWWRDQKLFESLTKGVIGAAFFCGSCVGGHIGDIRVDASQRNIRLAILRAAGQREG